MIDKIQFVTAGEWTMVYLNGTLVHHGDSYLADQWLQARVGVEVIDDEDSLSVPDGHHPLATFAEFEAARDALDVRRAEADRLRAAAAELTARADQLAKP